MRVAWHLLRSVADAEDVLHDVFVGLPEALKHYDENGRFDSWLRTVTARVALTRLRRVSQRREESLHDASSPHRNESNSQQVPGDIVERVAINDALGRLPDALRTVFVLKVIEGHSHNEIAAMLSISAGASEVRLVRAMKHLRLSLGAGND